MQESLEATVLVLPMAQLYIVVAILWAVAALTSADVREKDRLLPKTGVKHLATMMLVGSWIALVQIIIAMIGKNDYYALSTWAVVGMVAHTFVLLLLLIGVSFWYWAIATFKIPPSEIPRNPSMDST